MSVKQVSIVVDNKPGELSRICDILEKENINIKGIVAATRLKPVQLHMVVDAPDRAVAVLQSSGFTVSVTEVIAVAAPDHPGGLNAILRTLLHEKINVETLYPFINLDGGEAILILEVDRIPEAREILRKHWITTFGEEIYKL